VCRVKPRVGFDLCYRLVKTANGEQLALVKTGIVCFDYHLKKVVSVPNDVKDIITAMMG